MPKKNTKTDPGPQQHLAEEIALADAGEATGVFLHELGNVLNNLYLSAKLMLRQLPEEYRPRLEDSCKAINAIAGQLRQLNDFRQGRRTLPYLVDLNALVQQVVAEHKSADIETDLDGSLTPLPGITADLKRIV